MKHVVACLALALTLSGCNSQVVPLPASAVTSDHATLSLKELSDRKQQLSGQVVQVYGYYVQESDNCVLYPDKESWQRRDNSLALWIGPVEKGSGAARQPRRDGEWALIQGKFVNASTGLFDAYFAQIREVIAFQLLTGNPDQLPSQR